MKKYITKEEFQIKRTKPEFIEWVDNKFVEIGRTKEGKKAVRFQTGILSEFVSEAYALRQLLPYIDDDVSTYECIIGNQNYDVLIDRHDKDCSNDKIEITEAHEGEVEHHRMILLEEKGHVSASGEIKKSGTKKTGLELEDVSMAHNLNDLLQQNLELISDAFKKKNEKPYDENTSLLIMFKDYMFRDEEHFGYVERLKEFIESEICTKNDKFKDIYVLGWSGKILVKC